MIARGEVARSPPEEFSACLREAGQLLRGHGHPGCRPAGGHARGAGPPAAAGERQSLRRGRRVRPRQVVGMERGIRGRPDRRVWRRTRGAASRASTQPVESVAAAPRQPAPVPARGARLPRRAGDSPPAMHPGPAAEGTAGRGSLAGGVPPRRRRQPTTGRWSTSRTCCTAAGPRRRARRRVRDELRQALHAHRGAGRRMQPLVDELVDLVSLALEGAA